MHDSRDDYRAFHELRHATLIGVLGRHVPAKVPRCLDIGGGGDIGRLADAVRERFAEAVYAVDRGDDVERARARGVLAEACDIDGEALPFADSYFDLILFFSVIEHLYNPRFALDEMLRVLKPGGILVVEAPNAVSLGRRLDALAGRNPLRFFNQYNALENKAFMVNCSVFYTAEEVEALLRPGCTIRERGYAMHQPKQNAVKKLVRHGAAALNPRLSDCFYVVAEKR